MNNNTYIFVLLILLCGATSSVRAQNKYVQVQTDNRLDSLVEKHIEANKAINGMQGYRVQIFFGSERKLAQDAKTKLLQLMPDEEVYLIYQQPYFKVRVGDYRTKLEAEAVYRRLLHEFDKLFIVPDKINLPKL
ncbi:MAG: SPOR domain-containing protein [Bacteroidota bacterium]